jgi:hypothetical protein
MPPKRAAGRSPRDGHIALAQQPGKHISPRIARQPVDDCRDGRGESVGTATDNGHLVQHPPLTLATNMQHHPDSADQLRVQSLATDAAKGG